MEERLIEFARSKSEYLHAKAVSLNDIVIEERVRLQCFHCEKYNVKWTCPPKIEKFDFKKLFAEYSNAMIVYCEIPYSNDVEYAKVRNDSTNLLHRTLLDMEKFLYENNESLGISFIGGSCKLCKNGCSTEKCRLPHMARIPLEATGVNVIKLIKSTLNMDVVFPLTGKMYRFGLLLW